MGKKNKLKASDTSAPVSSSVGATLSKQREKLGLSAEECASALKISQCKLAELEANDYTSYSSEIFVRGHLKNYAKLVNLPSSDIIAIYNEGNPISEELVEPAMPIGMESRSRWWLPYSIVLAVLLVWFVVYQMMGGNNTAPDPLVEPAALTDNLKPTSGSNDSQTAAASSAPVVSDNAPIVSGGSKPDNAQAESLATEVPLPGSAEGTSVDIPILASTVPAAELMQSTQESIVSNVSASSIVASEAGEKSDSLRFVFSQDCWLEVRNQAGKLVKSGLQRKGTTLNLEGEGPFKVTLGNAKGASLVFNNEPVVLANKKLLKVVVGG